MSSPRVIRLRRPPTLAMQDGVFVPHAPAGACSTDVLEEVDRRWDQLRKSNPAYFDGRLCHVLGVHRNGHGGASLHVMDCAYRFFAVQSDDFDLGARPLGVKGVIERDGHLLMGLRSNRVAMYKALWEFAPSGSVEFGRLPHEVITRELLEETGLRPAAEPVAIAILFDTVLRCWELIYQLPIDADATPSATDEYPEIRWFDRSELPSTMSPVAKQIARLIGD